MFIENVPPAKLQLATNIQTLRPCRHLELLSFVLDHQCNVCTQASTSAQLQMWPKHTAKQNEACEF